MNAETINQEPSPLLFDAPVLSDADTLRVLARHDATSERRRYDAGFQSGHAAGEAAGRAEVNAAITDHRRNAERLDALCRALEDALTQTRQHEEASIAAVEDAIVEMSLQIAELLVHREITEHNAVVDVIRNCLDVSGADEVVTRVHPDDLACADEAQRAGLVAAGDAVRLIADPTVERGGCIVDVGSSRLDGQIAPAIGRIRTALTTA